MEISNTEDEYGLLARAFHWIVAVLILGLLPVGLFMGGMENSPLKLEIYAMHKSFGLFVFFLGLARIAWRFISPPPDHLETHAHWEVTLASAAHFWLYVCMIGMPLSGWLMSNAGEFPVPFFGIQMPILIGKDEGLGNLFNNIHAILAYTLLFVLGLHIAGALKHHVIDKDETLQRMVFKKEGFLLPVIVVLAAGASFTACAYLIGVDFLNRKPPQEIAAKATAETAAMPSVDNLPEHGWAIIPSISKLQFQAVLYNAPFTGEFGNFNGTIIFNPDDLSTAKADITIDMTKVATGDADRDTNIVGTEWFDSEKFPKSHFVTTSFEKAEGNNYIAVGNLTIRDKTMPLIIPFTLEVKDNTAHMLGGITLNRTNFGVGQGQWADESTVGHDVKVIIDLKAAQ